MSKVADDLRSWVKESKEKNCEPCYIGLSKQMGVSTYTSKFERMLFLKLADRIEAEQREIIEAQQSSGHYSAHYIMRVYGKSNGKPFKDGESITQWLDRYYIPRPCFEDGKPMHLGDMCDFGDYFGKDERVKEIFGLHYVNDGEWTIQPLHETYHARLDNCSRPSKVLDADGVEIKVGDTVYRIHDGHQFEVVAIGGHNGKTYVWETFDIGTEPEELTHREPDSIKRVRDDIADYLDASSDEWKELRGYCDRLTALIEREK